MVLLHITLKVPGAEQTWLATLNTFLDPLRLPLFFLVSGYFSYKVFRYNFAELFTRRLWFFLIPYLVWMSVEHLTKQLEYQWVFGDSSWGMTDMVYNLLLGHTMAWFIHALILFNLFLWCVRKLPAWAGIGLSFTPVIFIAWQEQFQFISKAIMFLPIFVGAAYLREPITRFAAAAEEVFHGSWTARSVGAYAAAIGTYCVGLALRHAWDGNEADIAFNWPLLGADFLEWGDINLLVRFAEQVLEVPAGIVGAVLISHIPWIAEGVKFVGRHTLPIYLSHPIVLTVGYGYYMAHHDYVVSLAGSWPLENTWFWIAMCFIFTAISSLALWALGKVPILGWTLVPPRIDRRRPAVEPMVANKQPTTR